MAKDLCCLKQAQHYRHMANCLPLPRADYKFTHSLDLRVCPWEIQAEPGRRWYSSNHRFHSNSAQMLGLVGKWSWQKIRSEYFIPFKWGGIPSKNGRFSLIYAYVISCLWFSLSTPWKAMWKWNSRDHVLLLSVSKQWHSFQLDILISLHGSILSKEHTS